MKKYELKDFDEFLLARDTSIRDMGWVMVRNSINVKTLSLEETIKLKFDLNYNGYHTNIDNNYIYYTHKHKNHIINLINRKLKNFSNRCIQNAIYNYNINNKINIQ